MSRRCTYPGCKEEVMHSDSKGGYCEKKEKGQSLGHWNDPCSPAFYRKICECGAEKANDGKYSSNHSHWCPAFEPVN